MGADVMYNTGTNPFHKCKYNKASFYPIRIRLGMIPRPSRYVPKY